MTYNPAIPQATDIPAQSQADMLTNFSQLNTIFDVDHVPYNDATAANRGKHDKSTYVEITPDPTTVANEIALYSKEAATVSELFLRREGNGNVIQMSVGTPIAGTAGSTFLPGGLIMKWGQKTLSGTTAAVNFTTLAIGNFPNNMYGATVTPISASAGLVDGNYPGVTGFSTTGFNINVRSNSTLTYFFVAIGN